MTVTEFVETTFVEFNALSDELIWRYIDTDEPMFVFCCCVLEEMHSLLTAIDNRDKAGGYGYQGLARFFVKRIDGCYYNVVGRVFIQVIRTTTEPSHLQEIGFPAARFFQELQQLDIY